MVLPTREGTNGARIPPNLHVIEHTPKPAFLFLKRKQCSKPAQNIFSESEKIKTEWQ